MHVSSLRCVWTYDHAAIKLNIKRVSVMSANQQKHKQTSKQAV